MAFSCLHDHNIILRLSSQKFDRSYKPTIGVDFNLKKMFVKDEEIRLQVRFYPDSESYRFRYGI